MNNSERTNDHSAGRLPDLSQLGTDLVRVSAVRRAWSLALPFLGFLAYAQAATSDHWALAVLATMGISFVTYGSVSHDLVHRSLGLSRRMNDLLLCVIELLAIRSGHAYQ